MVNQIDDFLNKNNVFAVVGVSRNPSKYGYIIYQDLLRKGYKVFPINPNAKMIDDDKAYASLSELPIQPDVVDIVVPPKIALEVVKECHELGIQKVWLQPGAESDEVIDFCYKHDIEVIYGTCVMVESSNARTMMRHQ
ncbi:MAG: CoA-binding protein [Promethearchaeota archaeon]